MTTSHLMKRGFLPINMKPFRSKWPHDGNSRGAKRCADERRAQRLSVKLCCNLCNVSLRNPGRVPSENISFHAGQHSTHSNYSAHGVRLIAKLEVNRVRLIYVDELVTRSVQKFMCNANEKMTHFHCEKKDLLKGKHSDFSFPNEMFIHIFSGNPLL